MLGQLGNSTTSVNSPAAVVVETSMAVPLTNVVSIASGGSGTCALTEASGVYCWGDMPAFSGVFAQVVTGTETWTDVQEIYRGGDFACVRRSVAGGSLYCWGGNIDGQIATPVSAAVTSVSRVIGVSGVHEAYAGMNFLCARTAAGVRCRGNNSAQRLGTMNPSTPLDQFESVVGGGTIVEFAKGGGSASTVCGFTGERDLYCWGDNPSNLVSPMGGSVVPVPTRITNLTRTQLP
jgi:alpha-tubulin suppressor-like RCC1 family protein